MTTPTERDRVTAAKIRLYAHYQDSAGGEGVTYRSWDDVWEDIAIALAAARAEGYAQGSDVAAQYTTSAALQNSVVDRLAKAESERDAALAKLETAEAEVARLRAKVNEALQFMADAPEEAVSAILEAHDVPYPADLLEAVWLIVADDSYKAERRAAVATIKRYGLIAADPEGGKNG